MPSQDALFSLGVEEEYQLIDPQTRTLCSSAEAILREASQEVGQEVQSEIHLSQLEVATPVCQTLPQVRQELQRLRSAVIRAAERSDRQIAAAGTHPFAPWHEQQITPAERYLALEHQYQQFVREQAVFGCHVHVGVRDRELAVQIINHARVWLAPLLALTANSPFWGANETGYASYRTAIYSKWPQAGPPHHFASLADYEELTRTLVAMGSIENARHLYWDMRVSERFPTVELRIMDQCSTIDETVLMAGLARGLVQSCGKQAMQGVPALEVRPEVLRFANWQAARYGLEGTLIDVRKGCAIPAEALLDALLDFVGPALQEQGDWEEVSRLLGQLLEHGNGATRQRAIYRATGSLQAVVDFVVAQTAVGIPEMSLTQT